MGHAHYMTTVVAEANFYNGLSPEDKQVVDNAMAAATAYANEMAMDLDSTGLGRIVKTNAEFDINILTESEREAFRQSTEGIADDLRNRLGDRVGDIVDQLQADLAGLGE